MGKRRGLILGITSQAISDKAEEKFLRVMLEDGDEIVPCIKSAALEQGLSEFRVAEMRGFWKDGFMNFFQGSKFKSRKSFDVELITAGSGKFVKKGNDYTGDLHIAVKVGGGIINGTLLKGKAAKELTIRLKFLQMV